LRTTFWPTGTRPSDVLALLNEALAKANPKKLTGFLTGTDDVVLSNGLTVRIYIKNIAGRTVVSSFHPIAGPGVTRSVDVLNQL
jgi:hypothetical protein